MAFESIQKLEAAIANSAEGTAVGRTSRDAASSVELSHLPELRSTVLRAAVRSRMKAGRRGRTLYERGRRNGKGGLNVSLGCWSRKREELLIPDVISSIFLVRRQFYRRIGPNNAGGDTRVVKQLYVALPNLGLNEPHPVHRRSRRKLRLGV